MEPQRIYEDHTDTHTQSGLSPEQFMDSPTRTFLREARQSCRDQVISDFSLTGEGRLPNVGNKLDRETPKETCKATDNILLSAS